MKEYNIEVKKEFNNHHNLAKIQEKFPELSPNQIVGYILDTECGTIDKKDDSALKSREENIVGNPNATPTNITNYTLDTTLSKNRTRYNESAIKKVDITTDIKPIAISDIITNIDDKDIKFISEGREINITGRKTINYQELFYMVLIEGRPLGYLMNVFTCNEYSILKGLQFLHAEARDEVIKAKIIEYSNIYFFKA
nr:MAG TPA: hypothetical protein [Caudoviricetes sp.]